MLRKIRTFFLIFCVTLLLFQDADAESSSSNRRKSLKNQPNATNRSTSKSLKLIETTIRIIEIVDEDDHPNSTKTGITLPKADHESSSSAHYATIERKVEKLQKNSSLLNLRCFDKQFRVTPRQGRQIMPPKTTVSIIDLLSGRPSGTASRLEDLNLCGDEKPADTTVRIVQINRALKKPKQKPKPKPKPEKPKKAESTSDLLGKIRPKPGAKNTQRISEKVALASGQDTIRINPILLRSRTKTGPGNQEEEEEASKLEDAPPPSKPDKSPPKIPKHSGEPTIRINPIQLSASAIGDDSQQVLGSSGSHNYPAPIGGGLDGEPITTTMSSVIENEPSTIIPTTESEFQLRVEAETLELLTSKFEIPLKFSSNPTEAAKTEKPVYYSQEDDGVPETTTMPSVETVTTMPTTGVPETTTMPSVETVTTMPTINVPETTNPTTTKPETLFYPQTEESKPTSSPIESDITTMTMTIPKSVQMVDLEASKHIQRLYPDGSDSIRINPVLLRTASRIEELNGSMVEPFYYLPNKYDPETTTTTMRSIETVTTGSSSTAKTVPNDDVTTMSPIDIPVEDQTIRIDPIYIQSSVVVPIKELLSTISSLENNETVTTMMPNFETESTLSSNDFVTTSTMMPPPSDDDDKAKIVNSLEMTTESSMAEFNLTTESTTIKPEVTAVSGSKTTFTTMSSAESDNTVTTESITESGLNSTESVSLLLEIGDEDNVNLENDVNDGEDTTLITKKKFAKIPKAFSSFKQPTDLDNSTQSSSVTTESTEILTTESPSSEVLSTTMNSLELTTESQASIETKEPKTQFSLIETTILPESETTTLLPLNNSASTTIFPTISPDSSMTTIMPQMDLTTSLVENKTSSPVESRFEEATGIVEASETTTRISSTETTTKISNDSDDDDDDDDDDDGTTVSTDSTPIDTSTVTSSVLQNNLITTIYNTDLSLQSTTTESSIAIAETTESTQELLTTTVSSSEVSETTKPDQAQVETTTTAGTISSAESSESTLPFQPETIVSTEFVDSTTQQSQSETTTKIPVQISDDQTTMSPQIDDKSTQPESTTTIPLHPESKQSITILLKSVFGTATKTTIPKQTPEILQFEIPSSESKPETTTSTPLESTESTTQPEIETTTLLTSVNISQSRSIESTFLNPSASSTSKSAESLKIRFKSTTLQPGDKNLFELLYTIFLLNRFEKHSQDKNGRQIKRIRIKIVEIAEEIKLEAPESSRRSTATSTTTPQPETTTSPGIVSMVYSKNTQIGVPQNSSPISVSKPIEVKLWITGIVSENKSQNGAIRTESTRIDPIELTLKLDYAINANQTADLINIFSKPMNARLRIGDKLESSDQFVKELIKSRSVDSVSVPEMEFTETEVIKSTKPIAENLKMAEESQYSGDDEHTIEPRATVKTTTEFPESTIDSMTMIPKVSEKMDVAETEPISYSIGLGPDIEILTEMKPDSGESFQATESPEMAQEISTLSSSFVEPNSSQTETYLNEFTSNESSSTIFEMKSSSTTESSQSTIQLSSTQSSIQKSKRLNPLLARTFIRSRTQSSYHSQTGTLSNLPHPIYVPSMDPISSSSNTPDSTTESAQPVYISTTTTTTRQPKISLGSIFNSKTKSKAQSKESTSSLIPDDSAFIKSTNTTESRAFNSDGPTEFQWTIIIILAIIFQLALLFAALYCCLLSSLSSQPLESGTGQTSKDSKHVKWLDLENDASVSGSSDYIV